MNGITINGVWFERWILEEMARLQQIARLEAKAAEAQTQQAA